jgi:hypothetical protein
MCTSWNATKAESRVVGCLVPSAAALFIFGWSQPPLPARDGIGIGAVSGTGQPSTLPSRVSINCAHCSGWWGFVTVSAQLSLLVYCCSRVTCVYVVQVCKTCALSIYLFKCAVAAKALLVDHPVAINELHKVVRALSFVHDTKNDLFIRALPLALIHKELSALQPLPPKHLDQDGCEGGGNDNARPTQRHTVRRKVSGVREPTVRRVNDKWARPLGVQMTHAQQEATLNCVRSNRVHKWMVINSKRQQRTTSDEMPNNSSPCTRGGGPHERATVRSSRAGISFCFRAYKCTLRSRSCARVNPYKQERPRINWLWWQRQWARNWDDDTDGTNIHTVGLGLGHHPMQPHRRRHVSQRGVRCSNALPTPFLQTPKRGILQLFFLVT